MDESLFRLIVAIALVVIAAAQILRLAPRA